MIIVKLKAAWATKCSNTLWGADYLLKETSLLKIDLSWFYGQEKRRFELDQFNTPSSLKLPEIYYLLPPFSRNLKIRKEYIKLDKLLLERQRFYFKEDLIGIFDARILRIKGPKYLDGYWQSEKYFDSIKDIIRADFKLKKPLSVQDLSIAEEMRANPYSVSVHIRRGDYVSDYKTIRAHLICTPDYYSETMNLMKAKLGNKTVFYIFSEDPDWCKSGVDYPSDFRIISDGKRSSSEELVMMSCCRNAIITNSSFSWWGAWLNSDLNKIVIYPKKWFYNHNAPDIPLPNWLPWQHSTKNDWKYIDIPFAKSRYSSKFGFELNLETPKRFTEKIQWLKIYDRNPLYTSLADKVAVRELCCRNDRKPNI